MPPVAPARRSRRRSWVALAMLLFAASALVGVVLVRQLGHRVQVLRAVREIQPGQVIGPADLEAVDVAVDGDVPLVAATERNRLAGLTAQGRIPRGSLVSPDQFQAGVGLPPGTVVVGLVLAPGGLPKADLRVGDRVNMIVAGSQASSSQPASGQPAAGAAGASPVIGEARVFALKAAGGDSMARSGGDDSQFVSLAVRESDAVRVSQAAATNSLRLVYLPGTEGSGR